MHFSIQPNANNSALLFNQTSWITDAHGKKHQKILINEDLLTADMSMW